MHVRRQAPIGPYVVDFVIHEKRLVIEVDGEHHQTAEGLAQDRMRDERLGDDSYRVLRLTTGELADDFEGCVVTNLREIGIA